MVGKILLVECGADGIVAYVNPNLESLSGLAAADLVGQPVWGRLVAADVGQRLRQAFVLLNDGGQPPDDEGPWTRCDGDTATVRWGYSVRRDAAGKVTGVVVAGYDAGRSRSITAELGESLDRYQGILDTAVDGIITISQRGLIETFNRAAERIFGYRAAEVIGRNVSMLMPAPYREQHDQYIDNYLTTRRKKIIGIGREVEGRRKDGTSFPLELAVGEVVTPAGRTFTGIVRDITDRKEAEAESRRRMNELAHVMRLRSMGELASGLAHEVNQPLTAIISNAQACLRLIQAGRAEPDLIREALQQIARQGERAGEVIRRLRKYVEKGELEKAPHDLNVSVVEVLELLAHELQVHRIAVHAEVAPQLPALPVDRVQIEQVLVNLIRNAVDAMDQDDNGTEHQLCISTLPGSVSGVAGILVGVRDNGPGISPAAAEHLFDSFFTTKKDGLGQGLSICKRIIEAHGGRIWAEPVDPRGALFQFWLPADPAS